METNKIEAKKGIAALWILFKKHIVLNSFQAMFQNALQISALLVLI